MNEDDSFPRPDAENQDAQPRVVAAVAASLLLLVVLGLFGGRIAFVHLGPKPGASTRGADELFQHGIIVKTDVDRSWDEIARAAPSGDAYAWADRDKGTVHVPISRAIDLVCAEQGAPEIEQQSRLPLP
jgi:hypothetical protein